MADGLWLMARTRDTNSLSGSGFCYKPYAISYSLF
jgi:hypothetical protein